MSAITEMLNNCFLFQGMQQQLKTNIVLAMTEKQVQSGDIVIRQGDTGDFMYIVASGIFDVFQRGADGADVPVFNYTNSGMFGERALLLDRPRAATVCAVTAGQLWALDRDALRHFLGEGWLL